jgi:hypothetical protein
MLKRLTALIGLLLFLGGCTAPPQEDIRTLYYVPMQCESTPWKNWYEKGNLQFVEEPTNEELITTYFGQEKGAEILEVEELERAAVACQSCNICPKNHFFKAKVQKRAVEILVSEGWRTESPETITENSDTNDEMPEASAQ